MELLPNHMNIVEVKTPGRWFKLVKVINVLFFISLIEPFFRTRPNSVVLVALVLGGVANAVVYKFQPNKRAFSTIIWGFYAFWLFVILHYYSHFIPLSRLTSTIK